MIAAHEKGIGSGVWVLGKSAEEVGPSGRHAVPSYAGITRIRFKGSPETSGLSAVPAAPRGHSDTRTNGVEGQASALTPTGGAEVQADGDRIFGEKNFGGYAVFPWWHQKKPVCIVSGSGLNTDPLVGI